MQFSRDAYVLYRDGRLQEEAQVVTRLGLYSKLYKDKQPAAQDYMYVYTIRDNMSQNTSLYNFYKPII